MSNKQELIDQLVVAKKEINKTISTLAKEVDAEPKLTIKAGDTIRARSGDKYLILKRGIVSLQFFSYYPDYTLDRAQDYVDAGKWVILD